MSNENSARLRRWDVCWDEDRIAATATPASTPPPCFSGADLEDSLLRTGIVDTFKYAILDPLALALVLPSLRLLSSEERVACIRHFWESTLRNTFMGGNAVSDECVRLFVQMASDVHALRFMVVAVMYEMLTFFAQHQCSDHFMVAETASLARVCIVPIAKQLARLHPHASITGLGLFYFEDTIKRLCDSPMTRVMRMGDYDWNRIGNVFGGVCLHGALEGNIYPALAKAWDGEIDAVRHTYARSVSLVLEAKLPTVLAQLIGSMVGGQSVRDIPSLAAWRAARAAAAMHH